MNELGNTTADKNYKPSGISRAEEAARKAYPYDGGTKGWICKSSRPIFIEGYKQAEKDTIERACQYLYEYNTKMAKMFGAKGILSCCQFTIDVDKFRKTLSLEEDQ